MRKKSLLRPPSSALQENSVLQYSGLRPPQKNSSSNPPASVLHKKFRPPILRPPSSTKNFVIQSSGLRPPKKLPASGLHSGGLEEFLRRTRIYAGDKAGRGRAQAGAHGTTSVC